MGSPFTAAYNTSGVGDMNRLKCSGCDMSILSCLNQHAYGEKAWWQCATCAGWFCKMCGDTLQLQKSVQTLSTRNRPFMQAKSAIAVHLNAMKKHRDERETRMEFDMAPFGTDPTTDLSVMMPLFKQAVSECAALNGIEWKQIVKKRKWEGGDDYVVQKAKKARSK